jgi:hypothetical protein
MIYAISASRQTTTHRSGQSIVDTYHLPTFYLDSDVQGFTDEAGAERVARSIVGDGFSGEVHVCAVQVSGADARDLSTSALERASVQSGAYMRAVLEYGAMRGRYGTPVIVSYRDADTGRVTECDLPCTIDSAQEIMRAERLPLDSRVTVSWTDDRQARADFALSELMPKVGIGAHADVVTR